MNNQPTTHDVLAPCPIPWCGDPGAFLISVADEDEAHANRAVICGNAACSLVGPIKPNEAEAIAAWNTRPDPAPKPAPGDVAGRASSACPICNEDQPHAHSDVDVYDNDPREKLRRLRKLASTLERAKKPALLKDWLSIFAAADYCRSFRTPSQHDDRSRLRGDLTYILARLDDAETRLAALSPETAKSDALPLADKYGLPPSEGASEIVVRATKAFHDFRRENYHAGHPAWKNIDWVTKLRWMKSMEAALATLPAAAPAECVDESAAEPWPGCHADLQRRRVTTLATLGLMLSRMAGGEVAEVEGFDAADLYAEVLMALAIEDADDADIALEVARDHPEGDRLASSEPPKVEPFGYYVEHKIAEPAFLRPPSYIPHSEPNYVVTPLYAHPPKDAALSAPQHPAEQSRGAVEQVAGEAKWLFGAFARGAGFTGQAYDDAMRAFEQSLAESVAAALTPTAPLPESAVKDAGECPSCHGLNTSHPDGCGRDPETGELNGTRLDAGEGGDPAPLAALAYHAWLKLPNDERLEERPYIMGFNAGWEECERQIADNHPNAREEKADG
jgi:hypothetical protein